MIRSVKMATSIETLIECVRKRWSSSGNEEAIKVANCMAVAAKVVVPIKGQQTETPSDSPIFDSITTTPGSNHQLMEAIKEAWPSVEWESVVENVYVGKLAESYEDNLLWRLILMKSDTVFPQHCYNSATELLHVLHAHDEALMGPCEQWTSPLKSDSFHNFLLSAPKTIKSGKEPLLALSALKGSNSELTWPDEKCGTFYGSNLMNVQFAGVDSVAQYYDKLAQDYDEAVRAWGYCLPETVVELLFKHAKNDLKGPDVTLLDLGCGNGLVGEALCKRHPFNHIVGLDISQKSLDVAQKRGCYLKLQQADLLKKLPVQKESFDFLLCIGTTSYLEPSILNDWLEVVRPGGIICFTHKSSVLGGWEAEQEKISNANKWSTLFIHPGIPYLPSLQLGEAENCKEIVRIYIYRKNDQ